jgi:hypothetical protein
MLIHTSKTLLEYKRLLRKINSHGIFSREGFFNAIESKNRNYIPTYFQGKIIPCLNHNKSHFISTKFLKAHCDRNGFYRSRSGITFHRQGNIQSTLKYLIRIRSTGLTAKEANKFCNRDCYRPLSQIEVIDPYACETIDGQKVFFYKPKKKKQLKNRLVDSAIKASSEPDSSECEIPLEDVSNSLKEIIQDPMSHRQMMIGFLKVHLGSPWRQLSRQMKYLPRYRTIAGIQEQEDLHYTTLNNYFLTLPIADLEELFRELVSHLRCKNVITGKYLAMDATHMFAWVNTSNMMCKNPFQESNSYTEKSILHLAQHGFHLDNFYGYKCHLLIDCECELPVAVIITSGNISDMTQIIPLMECATSIDLKEVHRVLGDAGYDNPDDIEVVNGMIKGKMIVDTNPRRNKFLKTMKIMVKGVFKKFANCINSIDDALKYIPQKQITDFGVKICSKKESALIKLVQYRMTKGMRVTVERVFSRLKSCLPFERPKLQKDVSVVKNIYFCLNWMLLVAMTAKRLGQDQDIRKMASVV